MTTLKELLNNEKIIEIQGFSLNARRGRNKARRKLIFTNMPVENL